MSIRIVHLVGAAMSRLGHAHLAELLRASADAGVARAVGLPRLRDVLVVRLSLPASELPIRVRSVPMRSVGSRALGRLLDAGGFAGAGGAVLHVWTEAALSLLCALDRARWPVLVDVADGRPLRELLARPDFRGEPATRVVACHAQVAACYRALGVPEGRCVVIEPEAPAGLEAREERRAARARLGLAEGQTAVVLLPPAERTTGAYHGAWGALLAEKVCPAVRLVVPSEGADVRRVCELVRACRHDWMLHVAPRGMSTAALVAAADVGMYLPARPVVPLDAVVLAARLGCRLILTAPAADVARGVQVGVVRADDPKDVARELVQTLERPGAMRVPRVESEAERVVRTRVGAYARIYDALAAMAAERGGVAGPARTGTPRGGIPG